MDSELKKKNDELQLENEELWEEIKGNQKIFDELHTQIIEEREAFKAITKKYQAIIKEYDSKLTELIDLNNWSIKLSEKTGKLKDNADEMQEWVISCQETKIEKLTKAPKANKENTDALWEPYRQKFNAYIADGKVESWARNEIGNLMEKDGVWKKASKTDSKKIITRPDRATLHRQLVTNRK